MEKLSSTKKYGDQGEQIAADHLKKNHYRILDRNYRCRCGEIDIIAEDGECLVFIEVKTTASDIAEMYKAPSEAVDEKKKSCIIECAVDYIKDKRKGYALYRFDVAEVYLNRETPEINYIKNAFYKRERTRRQWNR